MALPNKTDLQTMDYAWRGAPHVRVEATPLQTTSLDIAWRGGPFVAAAGGFFARYYYDMIAQSRLGS